VYSKVPSMSLWQMLVLARVVSPTPSHRVFKILWRSTKVLQECSTSMVCKDKKRTIS
jgi:hypothetical protein